MKKTIKRFIWILVLVILIIAAVMIYKKYNYNDFNKSVELKGLTTFTRDSDVTCSDTDSYKIENTDYNDAMFYETISVTPNTPYKVTCKVKVENVENENDTRTGGAQICIEDTTERSITISGTEDWQEITFYFNSKNREEVKVGFRLGGYEERSKGTAWFTDLKIEVGSTSSSDEWNMACFIFPELDVDVEVNGETKHVNVTMSDTDIQDLQTNLARFQTSIASISNNKIKITYDVYVMEDAITSLTYDEENGYYVAPEDVYDYINSYVEENEYDYIFVGIRMADTEDGNTTLASDWIGLGSMEYYGIGFSNIRLPDSDSNYVYKYSSSYNLFPEEVYVHEFLHTLERNAKAFGYAIPGLHDYSTYGYSEDKLEGLKEWYTDYINQEIDYNGTKIGLPEDILTYKPAHESNFKYSLELDAFKEPQNIIEVIRGVFSKMTKVFSSAE